MSIAEKLTTIAENEPKVYEAGKNAENKALWSALQNNGERTNFARFLWYTRFVKNNFKPIHDMHITALNEFGENHSLQLLFPKITNETNAEYEERLRAHQIDIEELETEQGIVFDTSDCTTFYLAFRTNLFVKFNTIDVSKATNMSFAFYDGGNGFAKKIGIKRMICSATTPWNLTFDYCVGLEYIGFEGEIGQNGLDLHYSTKLNKESLLALIDCLIETPTKLTVTLGGTNLAKLTDAEKAVATQKGWTLA